MSHQLLERTTHVPAPLEEVFPFFSDPRNLARLTPPSMGFKIVQTPPGDIRKGDLIDYRIRLFGVPIRWRTRIESWNPNESFSDLQLAGPYRYWLHTHEFRPSNSGTEMRDGVEYSLPFGFIGAFVGGWFVRRQLEAIFDFREGAIRSFFGARP